MPVPQAGIFAVGTPAHSYLEFDLRGDAEPLALVEAVARLGAPHTSMGGVNLVAGFRPELWDHVAPGQMPDDAASFDAPLRGAGGYEMPGTQHDAWLWIAGPSRDVVFDVGRDSANALLPVARLADETTGWTYHASRDLTGFEDGTENPTLLDAPAVALVPDGEPGAASSVVLVQRWRHESDPWNALGQEGQELAMGRTKTDSIELDEEAMPVDAHVNRTSVEENGEELDIFRRNTPYGDLRDHGTYFVGFSRDQRRLALMLQNMAGVGDGIRDALTRYTTPQTGAYYAVPSVEAIARFA
ncbi:MAG TPA: Dyp-type peroxidase [Frankiaceae bacterium]|nr:Dyp-type peroxidase [Frankiaceae bacterium]